MIYVGECGSEVHQFTQHVTLYSCPFVRFTGLPDHPTSRCHVNSNAAGLCPICSRAVPHICLSCLFSERQYSINSVEGWLSTCFVISCLLVMCWHMACSVCGSNLFSLSDTTLQQSAGKVTAAGRPG